MWKLRNTSSIQTVSGLKGGIAAITPAITVNAFFREAGLDRKLIGYSVLSSYALAAGSSKDDERRREKGL